jgi:hypothetical protein
MSPDPRSRARHRHDTEHRLTHHRLTHDIDVWVVGPPVPAANKTTAATVSGGRRTAFATAEQGAADG